jgi:tetratricopeptide (TPR) repeat protein
LKIECHEFIGKIFRAELNHEKAIVHFKKMLYLAWSEKCYSSEIKAYDNMSIDYFYLGDLDKAEYYQQRYLRGKTENGHSISKGVALNLIKAKRMFKLMDYTAQNQNKIDKQQRLPSPSGNGKGTFNKSINVLPYFTEFETKDYLVFNKPK